MKQYGTIEETFYFWFAANTTSGSGGDGASPAADVRLAGAAADAIPVLSPTPVLLTHTNYPAGCYEIAIAATTGNGFVTNNTYAVFFTLAIDAQNPTGFVGSFDLKPVLANAKDSVWNAILTGATFNIPTSAGRRVRQIGAYAIHDGTAQAGANVSITFAATASAIDGTYNRNLVVITGGTGMSQTRTIIDFDGTTKIAIVDRGWRTDPDATSEYQVVPDDTPLVVDQGVAQAGSTSSTIKLRAYASAINDIYLCNIVIIVAGTGRGQARLVGAYNGATKVITLCGDDWITTPDDTSVYVIIPYGATCTACLGTNALAQINAEIDNALNTAIPGSPTAGSINEKIKALPSGIAKNATLPNLDIYMLLEDGITAATGKTVTGQIRKDAGSFTGLTNAITEVSGGLYTIADGVIQAEMNADKVTLKFTADGCRDTIMIIYPT